VETLIEPAFTLPTKLTEGDDTVKNILLTSEIDSYIKGKSCCRQNKATIYAVVLEQYTEAMKARLETDSGYENISNDHDVIKLLKLIRDIAFDYESEPCPFLALHMALKNITVSPEHSELHATHSSSPSPTYKT